MNALLKNIISITILIFVSCFAAFAQTNNSQDIKSAKIGVIDTTIFSDEKLGIPAFVMASGKLEAELSPFQVELDNLSAQIQNLEDETQLLQNQKFPQQNKLRELEKLKTKYNSKKTDFDLFREKQNLALVIPVIDSIRKASLEFAKQKGYVLIFDKAQIDSYSCSCDFSGCNDITKEFIQFYNEDYKESSSNIY